MAYYGWGKPTIPGTKIVEEVPNAKLHRVGAKNAATAFCKKCHTQIGTKPFVEVDGRIYHYDPCARVL